MNTVDWLRRFKNKIEIIIQQNPEQESYLIISEIAKAYIEILEEMINPEER